MKKPSWLSPLFIGLAIAFQVGVVASMAISRESILATGTPYLLQTAPIDPRDIFRGDYVRLNYLFSTIPVSMMEKRIVENGLRKGQKVYLSLRNDVNGIAQGERLYSVPPDGKPYLTGRIRYDWPYRYYSKQPPEKRSKVSLWPVPVKYGIEQYYVEQGSGRTLEKMRGGRNDFQLPMLVRVRVSPSGEAVISAYEWATVAVKTEIAKSPERDAPDDKASAVMRLTLKNNSAQPITLPLKGGNCSFAVMPVSQAGRVPVEFAASRSDCDGVEAQPVILAPQQTYSVSFDLNQPWWWVVYNDKPAPMGKLPWGYRFRIRYQGAAIPGVRGEILSRAFSGRGNID